MSNLQKRADAFATETLRFQAIYKGCAKAVGLTDNFITVLHAIYQNPDKCTQKFLVESTYLPKQTIHFVIDKLQQQKLIVSAPSSEDGRVKILKPTKNGEKYLAKKIEPFMTDTERALKKLTAAEQKQLVELFNKYNNHLKTEVKKNIL